MTPPVDRRRVWVGWHLLRCFAHRKQIFGQQIQYVSWFDSHGSVSKRWLIGHAKRVINSPWYHSQNASQQEIIRFAKNALDAKFTDQKPPSCPLPHLRRVSRLTFCFPENTRDPSARHGMQVLPMHRRRLIRDRLWPPAPRTNHDEHQMRTTTSRDRRFSKNLSCNT